MGSLAVSETVYGLGTAVTVGFIVCGVLIAVHGDRRERDRIADQHRSQRAIRRELRRYEP